MRHGKEMQYFFVELSCQSQNKHCSVFHGDCDAFTVSADVLQICFQSVALVNQIKQGVHEIFFFHRRSLLRCCTFIITYCDYNHNMYFTEITI